MTSPVPIVALDYPTGADALALVDDLRGLCSFFKVGSELFTAEGPSILRALHARGASVFLDLKFHDIPNTVRGAVAAAAQPGVELLTVHASGGRAMMEAAVAAAGATGAKILAVTVLTSLDGTALGEAWGRDAVHLEGEVERLATLAASAGAHGVVCSGLEAASLRRKFGSRLATLVPGVRLAGGATQDQRRVVTPRQAADAGAAYVVLGRAVSGAGSPRDAMTEVLALLQ